VPYTAALVAIIAGYAWIVDRFVDARPPWQHVPTVLALGTGFLRAARAKEWGFASGAFGAALLWTALMTLPLTAAVLYAGDRMGQLHSRPQPWLDLLYLVFWGGAQQFLLQTVVLREAQRKLPPIPAVVVAALIFGFFHLPNPLLTVLTAVAALGWCAIYTRAPNIVPLAFSHAILTLAVLHAFDAETTGHLRTGWRYLEGR
jgi:membrane protease YdiL (CAAX protease family)